jgi:2-aminoethylphosphonate-pyruvate transaminase
LSRTDHASKDAMPAIRAASETGDPLLLTPGPLTTAKSVKEVMVHDWGSRDAAFIAINKAVLEGLPRIIHGEERFVTVPMQGSGTFAVEAMLTSFVPRDGKVLLLINGAYGQRAKRILDIAGRKSAVHETPEDTPPDLAAVERMLKRQNSITHVFAVYCETTSGICNPIEAIAEVAARHGKRLLVDAMSAFGALPLDSRKVAFDAVAASSNKCIEGVPGLGFVLARKEALAEAKGNATTLVLDLFDQHQNFEKTGQYRFTPPIHVIVAFHQALDEFWQEGGVEGRGGRYAENGRILIEGMRALGFETLLPAGLQAPIIVTFHMPRHPNFVFQRFYDGLKERGYVIYPGKLTVADSFRIGCIGRLYPKDMRGALEAVREVLTEMKVDLTPAQAA